jgi:hypothetical protein
MEFPWESCMHCLACLAHRDPVTQSLGVLVQKAVSDIGCLLHPPPLCLKKI